MDTDDEDDEDLEDSDEDGYASSGPGPLTLVMDHTWAGEPSLPDEFDLSSC